MSTKIHKTAIIDKSAEIDTDVEIAPYAVIGKKVKVGSGTFIGPHSYIEFAEIGKNNHLTASAFIGMPPQDFSYKGEETRIVIGAGNIIREGASLHRGSAKTGVTKIGNNCMFMANSHVGHDALVGNGVIIANSTCVSGHCIVEDNVVFSGLVAVHQFVSVGELAMIGGGAMVVMDIPPYCSAQGDRAKLTGLNLVGMARNAISPETIRQLKQVYKTLFMSGLRLGEAIKKIESENLSKQAKKMIAFCKKTNLRKTND
jgi:UDP-N-acetylglucosamine acyltransferase